MTANMACMLAACRDSTLRARGTHMVCIKSDGVHPYLTKWMAIILILLNFVKIFLMWD